MTGRKRERSRGERRGEQGILPWGFRSQRSTARRSGLGLWLAMARGGRKRSRQPGGEELQLNVMDGVRRVMGTDRGAAPGQEHGDEIGWWPGEELSLLQPAHFILPAHRLSFLMVRFRLCAVTKVPGM
jgi:hypothetical protein